MWFQYLRSSIPVMDNAFEDIGMQMPPLYLSNQKIYIQTEWDTSPSITRAIRIQKLDINGMNDRIRDLFLIRIGHFPL